MVGPALAKGLFIALYDKETLALYVANGVYGPHMRPLTGKPTPQSRHFHVVADLASTRAGDHVFFFGERTITYGGQVVGSDKHASFYLNGPFSEMGVKAKAPLVWDESNRSVYTQRGAPGLFTRNAMEDDDPSRPYAQPYLLRFKDQIGLAGRAIVSDDLYFELGTYPYPLPASGMAGMSFCVMTPREVDVALELLHKAPAPSAAQQTLVPPTTVAFSGTPTPYDPSYGLNSLNGLYNEAHLEATILANPQLAGSVMKNGELVRQAPISPFKTSNMDRADIGIYNKLADGTIPDRVVELKLEKLNAKHVEQVRRYAAWLNRRVPNEAPHVDYALLGESIGKLGTIPAVLTGKLTVADFHGAVQKH